MDKFGSIKASKPVVVNDYGDDPDAKRKEQLKDIKHRNSIWFYRSLPWIIWFFLAFLVILFFIIFPLSEMSLDYNSAMEAIKDYCIVFLSTSKTIGIALATLIVSDIIKRIISYIKNQASNDE